MRLGSCAVVRRIGCRQYDQCLKRAASRRGDPTDFNCADCGNYEEELWTEAERQSEELRASKLLIAIFPELTVEDPASHEGLAEFFRVAEKLDQNEQRST